MVTAKREGADAGGAAVGGDTCVTGWLGTAGAEAMEPGALPGVSTGAEPDPVLLNGFCSPTVVVVTVKRDVAVDGALSRTGPKSTALFATGPVVCPR